MNQLQINDVQKQAVDKVAQFIVRFGLTLPAIVTLESLRPLSFVGSQFMHILSPSISAFLSPHLWNEMAKLLEEREGIDYVISTIETLDAQENQK